MKYLIISLAAVASLFSACQSNSTSPNTTEKTEKNDKNTSHPRNPIRRLEKDNPNSVGIYNFQTFQPFLQPPNQDTLYIINFWATWCAPCVAELPYFMQAAIKNANNPVKFILVSLDFERDLDGRFKNFIKEHPLPAGAEYMVLLEPDPNNWIPKIDPDWDGAIPATLMYKGQHRAFYPQSFEQAELDSIINKIRSK